MSIVALAETAGFRGNYDMKVNTSESTMDGSMVGFCQLVYWQCTQQNMAKLSCSVTDHRVPGVTLPKIGERQVSRRSRCVFERTPCQMRQAKFLRNLVDMTTAACEHH
jgi:hypothetical protein